MGLGLGFRDLWDKVWGCLGLVGIRFGGLGFY